MKRAEGGLRNAAWGMAAISVFALSGFPACSRKAAPVQRLQEIETDAPPANRVEAAAPTPPAEIWKHFDGERAMADVRKQVEFGPRPSGSPEIEPARQHIVSALEAAGWGVERQEFMDTTPRGPMKFANLIGRFAIGQARPVPSRSTGRALVDAL